MRIEVFLDDNTTPLRTITPPERFEFDTTGIEDGPHRLRFRAYDNNGLQGERLVPFNIRNGPAIAVHGIVDGDTIDGSVPVLVNAYGATVGDEFEPVRMETPAPIPTWTWVLCLLILAWAAGYLSLEFSGQAAFPPAAVAEEMVAENRPAALESETTWEALGEQVYGNYCAACHQANGTGLAGVFPPLKGNPAVLAEDPSEHILSILKGLSGKIINGIAYPSPMPAFGPLLTDEEVAAVVNHERTAWGNASSTVTAADVAALR